MKSIFCHCPHRSSYLTSLSLPRVHLDKSLVIFIVLTRWLSAEGAVAWSFALDEELFFPAFLYAHQVVVMSCSIYCKACWQESRHEWEDEHVAGFILQYPHSCSQGHFSSLEMFTICICQCSHVGKMGFDKKKKNEAGKVGQLCVLSCSFPYYDSLITMRNNVAQ